MSNPDAVTQRNDIRTEPRRKELAVVAIISALLGSAGGTAVPVLWPNVVRPDEYRGTDAKLLEARMLNEINSRMELFELRFRETLPPRATRQRIRALEEQMRRIIPTWAPPTHRFSESDLEFDG